MMSLDKWMKAKQLCKEVEIPFIMVITFAEGTYYGVFAHNGLHDVTYGFGGRYDRGDAQDVEPMIYLPLKKFQKIEGIQTTTDQAVHSQPLAASPAYAQTLDEGVIIPFEQYSMFLGQLYEKTSKASAQPLCMTL